MVNFNEKPIKSVHTFKWFFDVVKDMDELEDRLKSRLFYVLRPQEDIIVATSLTNPSMIILILIQKTSGGGDLIVLQNPGGWYEDEDIISHIPLFYKTAGIKMKP